jgi:hypothetical protein
MVLCVGEQKIERFDGPAYLERGKEGPVHQTNHKYAIEGSVCVVGIACGLMCLNVVTDPRPLVAAGVPPALPARDRVSVADKG